MLDYIAMDVKAPWSRYGELAGGPIDTARLKDSMRLVTASGVAHEFRTTEVSILLNAEDMAEIRAQLPAGSRHRLQAFRSGYALDSRLRAGDAMLRTCSAI